MKNLFSVLVTSLLLLQSVGHAQGSWFSSGRPSESTEKNVSKSHAWSHGGLSFGIFDYEINSTPGDTDLDGSPHEDKSMGYKINLDYAVGYRSAFEVRARCSFGGGFSNLVDPVSLSVDIPSQTYLFSSDIAFLVPIPLNKKANLSLLPAVGFGVHQNFTKLMANSQDESTKGSFYRNRILAPYCGLFLQITPTEKLFLRSGFTVQFPYGSERFVSTYFSDDQSRKSIGSRRHGAGAEFTAHYAVSRGTAISASINMLSLSAGGDSSLYFKSSELSYTLGFLVNF